MVQFQKYWWHPASAISLVKIHIKVPATMTPSTNGMNDSWRRLGKINKFKNEWNSTSVFINHTFLSNEEIKCIAKELSGFI